MQNAADYYRDHEVKLYIETVKGNKFYYEDPVFDIQEIAHATAMQCRFTGHTSRFYSVAEHQIVVANIMDFCKLGAPIEGLLHDGTEAYLSDIAAPWKAMLPDYKKVEGVLEVKLRRHFGLPDTITPGCKRADWLALFVETMQLIPSMGADWVAPPGVKEQAAELLPRYKLDCWVPQYAKAQYLAMYDRLTR